MSADPPDSVETSLERIAYSLDHIATLARRTQHAGANFNDWDACGQFTTDDDGQMHTCGAKTDEVAHHREGHKCGECGVTW